MVSFSLQQDRTLSRHSNCTKTKFIHKSSNAPLKVGRSENRRPPQTTTDYHRPPHTTAGQIADHHRTWKIITNAQCFAEKSKLTYLH